MHSYFLYSSGGWESWGMKSGGAKSICVSKECWKWNKEPRCSGKSRESWINSLQHNRTICSSVDTRLGIYGTNHSSRETNGDSRGLNPETLWGDAEEGKRTPKSKLLTRINFYNCFMFLKYKKLALLCDLNYYSSYCIYSSFFLVILCFKVIVPNYKRIHMSPLHWKCLCFSHWVYDKYNSKILYMASVVPQNPIPTFMSNLVFHPATYLYFRHAGLLSYQAFQVYAWHGVFAHSVLSHWNAVSSFPGYCSIKSYS